MILSSVNCSVLSNVCVSHSNSLFLHYNMFSPAVDVGLFNPALLISLIQKTVCIQKEGDALTGCQLSLFRGGVIQARRVRWRCIITHHWTSYPVSRLALSRMRIGTMVGAVVVSILLRRAAGP